MRKQGFTFICIFLFLLGTKVKVKKIRHIERTWLEGIAATAAILSITCKIYPAGLTVLNYSAFFSKFFGVSTFDFFGNLFKQQFLFHRKFHTRYGLFVKRVIHRF